MHDRTTKMNSHTRTVPEEVLLDSHFMVSSAVSRDCSSVQIGELEPKDKDEVNRREVYDCDG